MKIAPDQVVGDLKKLFCTEQVVTDLEALKEHDSDNRCYAKSNNIYSAPLPICILNVDSTEEVAKALKYCNDNEISAIPRTGGSSYEGLLTAVNNETVMIDASSMNRVLELDEYNMRVTCQCGVPLKGLEESLQAKGLTTGHSPQSLPVAQMGGLVATRSIGQFSTYYGAIEDIICGMEAVLPDGEVICIRNVPRRSTGPDLRHLFLGSEGALGFITEVTVKIFRYYPDDFWKGGYIMPNMEVGFDAVRNIMAAGYKPSVVRLYDKTDFDHNFGSVELAEGETFMFFVAEGPPTIAKATGDGIDTIAKDAGGRYIGTDAVDHWLIHRNDLCNSFRTLELRLHYQEVNEHYSTTEISASYTDIKTIYENVIAAVSEKIDNLIFVGGHVSHAYQTGVNVYFVHKIRVSSPEAYEREHQTVVDTICEEVLKAETGGCVHHHGMGKERVKFAPLEHGTSYRLMKDIKKMMDPKGIMNPGVLVEAPQ